MDIEKLLIIAKNINDVLVENEATIEDVVSIGINLIVDAWSTDPDRENLVDEYVKVFKDNFIEHTCRILSLDK